MIIKLYISTKCLFGKPCRGSVPCLKCALGDKKVSNIVLLAAFLSVLQLVRTYVRFVRRI